MMLWRGWPHLGTCTETASWHEAPSLPLHVQRRRDRGRREIPGGQNPARRDPHRHAPGMFVVSEKDVTGIRTAFDRGGELSAAIELRRLFPGIIDNEQAGTLARTIAGGKSARFAVADGRANDRCRAPDLSYGAL
jgi:hypothetical protein